MELICWFVTSVFVIKDAKMAPNVLMKLVTRTPLFRMGVGNSSMVCRMRMENAAVKLSFPMNKTKNLQSLSK